MSEDTKINDTRAGQGGETQEPSKSCGCGDKECYLPEASFTTFVLSLASSAMVHLGETPEPDSGQVSVNLPLAKHTIDILGMLERKTCGNLGAEESKVLSHLLYELRLTYVAKTK